MKNILLLILTTSPCAFAQNAVTVTHYRTGGPAGFGWPFGRDVYRAEILRVIQDVPGVDHVNSLTLASDQGAATCGNISVCATWLVTSGAHQVQTV